MAKVNRRPSKKTRLVIWFNLNLLIIIYPKKVIDTTTRGSRLASIKPDSLMEFCLMPNLCCTQYCIIANKMVQNTKNPVIIKVELNFNLNSFKASFLKIKINDAVVSAILTGPINSHPKSTPIFIKLAIIIK